MRWQMGRYQQRVEAGASVWPDIDPQRFPNLQEMVSERLKELETGKCSAADSARQGSSPSSGGLTWLVLAGVGSFVFSHLHQDLGPFKNHLVAYAIIAAWILFLAFLLPAVVPSFLSFQSTGQRPPEKEVAKCVEHLANDPAMTDEIATRAIRNLLWRQRSVALARAADDLKWMRRAQTLHATVSLLLVLDLIVIGGAFVFAPSTEASSTVPKTAESGSYEPK